MRNAKLSEHRRRRTEAGSAAAFGRKEDYVALDGFERESRRQVLKRFFSEAREMKDNVRLQAYLDKIEPYLNTTLVDGPIARIRGMMQADQRPFDPSKRSVASKRRFANKMKFYASLRAHDAMVASRPLKPPGRAR